ncbi:hypothetical protein BD769DRAFT_1000917 [Suillus cothurnatus]|nr:hypothetical protein BD769DRAFT_1000917 [Suillus cothurnatus]
MLSVNFLWNFFSLIRFLVPPPMLSSLLSSCVLLALQQCEFISIRNTRLQPIASTGTCESFQNVSERFRYFEYYSS